MNTILYGNGFNRLNDVTSWEDLVHFIDDSKDIYKIPNTLQFEGKVVYVGDEYTLKKQIAESMKSYTSHKLFIKLLKLEVDHFITTNYDYVPDNTLESLKYSEERPKRDKSEALYSIHRTKCYTKKRKKDKNLWRIHGEISNPKSIILGYNHYCNYVGQIKKYISGEYNYPKNSGKTGLVPKMDLRLLQKPSFEFLSWIDLFFVSDIYIIGFGLDYNEIDLWWILTIRQRLKKKLMKRTGTDIIDNKIVYYGNCDSGKISLLNSLDVEVYIPKARKYPNQYKEFIKDIKKRIK